MTNEVIDFEMASLTTSHQASQSAKANASSNPSTSAGATKTFSPEAVASLRNYLANSYEFDITSFRCNKTGRLTRQLTDRELFSMWALAKYDLVVLSERLEYLHSKCVFDSLDWLYTDDDSLDILRCTQPEEFFCYASKNLIGLNSYWLIYRDSKGDYTSEGKTLMSLDFNQFAELVYNWFATEQGAAFVATSLQDLNEKLLLVLSIGATDKIENIIKQELSFEWLAQQLTAGTLADSLTKFLNQIINAYKLKHKIGFHDRLTVNDINRLTRLAQAERQAELAKANKAAAERRARLIADTATSFQRVKRGSHLGGSHNDSLTDRQTEQLLAELMLVNNDRKDYISQLTIQRANAIFKDNDKGVAKLNQLAKQALASRATIAREQGLGCQPFKLAGPIKINGKPVASVETTSAESHKED